MILGTGAKKVKAARRFIGACAVNRGYKTIKTPVLSLALLLCLCVSSWATCWNGSWSQGSGNGAPAAYWWCTSGTGCSGTYPSCNSAGLGSCEGTGCPNVRRSGNDGLYYTNILLNSRPWCSSEGNCTTYSSQNYAFGSCYYGTRCSTQAEADSVAASLASNACTEYKDDCESRGGVWDGQVVDDSLCSSTCNLCGTPESQAMREYIYNSCCEGGLTPQYSCGFPGGPSSISGMVYSDILSMGCNTTNWETNKICEAFYNESSSSESSSSSSAQSSSSVSEYCLIFPNDLACICAADSTNPDCDYLRSSSSAEPGSSGGGGDTSSDSGGGGTPSESSASGGVAGDDWEYDYRDSLHRIINATSLTARNTDSIEKHTGAIASILRSAKCLFEDCTNYDQLKVALDSNIVIPDGDTAGVIGSMSPLDSGMMEFLDAVANGDINGIGPESLQTALLDFGDKVGGLYGDSSGIKSNMEEMGTMIQNHFPTAQWSYTGACPAALNRTISFNMPLVGNIETGKKLGTYVCEPLPALGVTLGSTMRSVVRLVVTIVMAFGIFKAATGLKHE